MTVQRGVSTPQDIPMSVRKFTVAGNPPPCFRDRWGDWQCGHDHDAEDMVELQDVYQHVEGWTVQIATARPERGVLIEHT